MNTTATTPRTVANVNTAHVTFDKARAAEWLASLSPAHAADAAACGVTFTIADSLGIRDMWPCGWADEALDKVRRLVERAIQDDVIRLGRAVRSVDLIPCRYKHNQLGARLLVTTRRGVTIAGGVPLWADAFTGGARGRAGALAALGKAALLIDALMTCYQADTASATGATSTAQPTPDVIGALYKAAGDRQLDWLDELMVKAGVMWQCKLPERLGEGPCDYMNRADEQQCGACNGPRPTTANA